ncbi:uncharacterized protein SCHCODRAFT_01191929 [Schizophyllum commune H4-8]|nr:uncharacterized protein SCHCODRAFT_01191929 [Schizophyllum commune H4-8]KAI5889735.1 hypothetical protein SCHCODRAFT_01191929 [Schizophyllum commune H4-8]
MAMKRKFDDASDDEEVRDSKQLKLVPFPTYSDDDSLMSDGESLYHHERYSSNASTSSSASSYSPSFLPSPGGYGQPSSPSEGRMQPGGFMDHGRPLPTSMSPTTVASDDGRHRRRRHQPPTSFDLIQSGTSPDHPLYRRPVPPSPLTRIPVIVDSPVYQVTALYQ